MTTKTLTAYFNSQLKSLGYDDIAQKNDTTWSLGHCQGDGVFFPAATLYSEDAKTLCDRLMTGKHRAAVKRAIDKDIEFIAGGKHDAEYEDWRMSLDPTPLEREACDKFVEAIKQDLKDLANRFETEGYAFLEATPNEDEPEVVITRNLGRLRMVVSKCNEDWFDLFGCDAEEDVENDTEVMKAIIQGEIKFFCLKVEVFDLTTLDEFEDYDALKNLATNYLGGCTLRTDEKFNDIYRSEVRGQITELVSECRDLLDMKRPEREAVFEAIREQERLNIIAERDRLESERRAAELKAIAEAEKAKEEREMTKWSGMVLDNSASSVFSSVSI
ncbi:hypothetical protein I7Z51_002421 [Vibrio parahaemolyticus]|uniref:hypothetical protein n=1 Tax=Vibrio TaxID=662 RepID=UPI001A8EEC08|nr:MULTISPECIES: hypothetical protein [Vibrio]EGQ7973499.1 hypothetical protein [Vibrio parahaemolyticus]MBO0208599.1 hypothetical protein [Vibrio sp. Vb0877]MCR9810938.1 hypothetical protein [Vibrio parahaemolyticus]